MCGTLCIYGVIGSGDTPGSDERDNSFGDLLDFHQRFDFFLDPRRRLRGYSKLPKLVPLLIATNIVVE